MASSSPRVVLVVMWLMVVMVLVFMSASFLALWPAWTHMAAGYSPGHHLSGMNGQRKSRTQRQMGVLTIRPCGCPALAVQVTILD